MVHDDRRKEPRRRTLKAGLIAFNRAATIDCRVRNLSVIGAGLEVASQLGIPDEFMLLVEHQQLKRRCRVVWRLPNKLGVEFMADHLAADIDAKASLSAA